MVRLWEYSVSTFYLQRDTCFLKELHYILSFERLAYRVFEETGGDNRKVLEDTGKSMVLQKMVQQHRKELAYLGSQMNKPGYLDEVKSLVSEFMQYDIREEENLEEAYHENLERNMGLRKNDHHSSSDRNACE